MHSDKILEIILEIQKDVQQIDKTLVRNTDSLDVHIKRTNILEKKMEKVENHVTRVEAIIRFILSGGILIALYEFLSKEFWLLQFEVF